MNDIISLRKRLGTPYIWDGFHDLFQEVIDEATANGDLIDISTCRFGLDCVYCIESKVYAGIKLFINAEEPFLNDVLNHNIMVGELKRGDVPTPTRSRLWLDFDNTLEKSVKTLLSTIKNSDVGVVWYASKDQIGYEENFETIMAVLNMTLYTRKFDITSNQKIFSVFDKYRSVLTTVDMLGTDSYWFIMGEAAVRCDVNERGEIRIPGQGTFVKEEFITRSSVIPYWIGTESISGNARRKEIRNELIKKIRTNEMIQRVKKSRSILGLIKQYGERADELGL